MGKVKNFKVELPSEFVKDKRWRDENIKASDVEKYEYLKAEIDSIPGEIRFPVELCSMLHQLGENQKRLEERLDLIYAMLQQLGSGNGVSVDGEEQSSGSLANSTSPSGRINWGDTEEEQKLTLYKVMEEAEKRGVPLRTTEFKKIGGKFSTVVSYSYKIFGSWKEAIKNYKENYRSQQQMQETASSAG